MNWALPGTERCAKHGAAADTAARSAASGFITKEPFCLRVASDEACMDSILGLRYCNQVTGPTLGYIIAALRETHVVDVDSNGVQYHFVYWQESSMAKELGEKH
eukprot:940107-Karenia_brevis.AAC.1